MRKSPKHSHGITPLQRFSQQSKVVQVLTYSSLIGLVISALLIFVDRNQENEFGFLAADKLDELLEMSVKDDKYCIIKFDAPYCFPCTHDNPADGKTYFQSIADRYVMYQLNALDLDGEGPQLTQHYQVDVLPTWLFLNSDGEEVYRWESSSMPPVETLDRLEALREITASTASIAQPVAEESLAEPIFTLNWQSGLAYWDAIRMAEKLEPMVLESVWTQPDSSGTWTVCSGTYHGIMEARQSRLFHTEWREHPLEIVPLKAAGWQLPSY